jgi:hypothetical protein
MNSLVKKKNILVSLMIKPKLDWRDDLDNLTSLALTEIALFFDAVTIDERREVYRLLESSGLKNIPVVHITNDWQSWELDYLTTTYQTALFILAIDNKALLFITSSADYAEKIILTNPATLKFSSLFTDEILTRSAVSGVCLDLKILEQNRRSNNKKYQTTIHVLDHHALKATSLGPVSDHWFKNLLTPQNRHLTSLTELNYLKNIPSNCLAEMIIINCDNCLAEQIEIKKYLESFIK